VPTNLHEADAVLRDQVLMDLALRMLRELEASHRIIQHALQLMNLEMRSEWSEMNAATRVDGEGATRANEREKLIARAEEFFRLNGSGPYTA